MAKALVFVAEIPARRKVWVAPRWIAKLRRDKWADIPCPTRSAASTLWLQLRREGFLAQTRSVDGQVHVFVKKAS